MGKPAEPALHYLVAHYSGGLGGEPAAPQPGEASPGQSHQQTSHNTKPRGTVGAGEPIRRGYGLRGASEPAPVHHEQRELHQAVTLLYY